ncbi:hypothetical protein HP15_743 [Marinobacter adhaerens HP15]|uniref:Uncharacterized protein n=1 Tax=Marinobacter adhaerens (strain DSM 23420 / HP15) TaxID=225937 RepID=E4PQG4_MARAH|nr:hypothetical protein HP15_743 [Marinobacter adhaerens HP15]
MIGVHLNQVAINPDNLHDLRFIARVGLELHANLQVLDTFEQ